MEVVRRIEAGLGGVEAGSDPAQWQVALGRQEQHDERRIELEIAAGEPQADLHRDQCDRQRGDQFQRQRRQERDPQRTHRGGPVLLGDLVHRVALRLGPSEQSQCRQPLDDVEEVPAEALEHGPLAGRAALGHPADQHHEHRDQRHGQRDQHGGQQVGEHDACPRHERHGHGQHQRREELTDVRFELVGSNGDDRCLAIGEPTGCAIGVMCGVVEHGDSDVVAK